MTKLADLIAAHTAAVAAIAITDKDEDAEAMVAAGEALLSHPNAESALAYITSCEDLMQTLWDNYEERNFPERFVG